MDTRVFITTLQGLVGKNGLISEGQRVRSEIWKDVVVDGNIIIKKGTPVSVRVEGFSKAKVAGQSGKISLGAYEVEATNGELMPLGGGYSKDEKGKVALVAGLALFVFLPLIFIKGKKANLPAGTVFDAFPERTVTLNFVGAPEQAIVPIVTSEPDLSFEVLYDKLADMEKPKGFPITITGPNLKKPKFAVDRVNGKEIKPVKVNNVVQLECNDKCTYSAEIPLKKLLKRLDKGINTINLATGKNEDRIVAETLLDFEV